MVDNKPDQTDFALEEGRHDYATTEVKLFGRWSYEGVTSKDLSLVSYINVKTQRSKVFLSFTAGRYQKTSFQKVQCPIVARFANSMMM